MRHFKIVALFLFASLFINSCKTLDKELLFKKGDNYATLADIEIGKALDRAQKTTTDEFFKHMMSNEIIDNKKKQYFFEVLFESFDKIYYGYLIEDNNGEQIADPFFYVDAGDVKTRYPGYLKFDGSDIKEKLFYKYIEPIIETKLKPTCYNSFSTEFKNIDFKLTDRGIESFFTLNGLCYEDKVIVSDFHIFFNPKNMDIEDEIIVEEGELADPKKSKKAVQEKLKEAETKKAQEEAERKKREAEEAHLEKLRKEREQKNN